MAEVFVDLDLDRDFDQYIELAKHPEQELILEALYYGSQIYLNSRNIEKAIEQTSKIVFALNSYNHNPKKAEKSKTSVTSTIENALSIFQSKLKQDIEVVKHFDEVSAIHCNPTEIIQVWTSKIFRSIELLQ